MRTSYENAVSLIFLSTLSAVGIATFCIPQNAINDIESRARAPFPRFNLTDPRSLNMRNLKAFPYEFEQFFNDRIALRERTIMLRNLLKLKVWNVSGAKNVVTGEKQYLFYEDDINQGLPEKVSAYKQSELQAVTEKFIAPYKALRSHGIKYLLVVVPGKSATCSSFLKADLAQKWKRVRMNQVLQALSKEGMPVLDLTDDLIANGIENPNYFKKDTHWNSSGALIASKAVEKKLSADFPAMNVIRSAKVSQTSVVNHSADLARMLAVGSIITETSSDVRLQLEDKPVTTEKAGHHTITTISKNNARALPEAVFFCDSFGLYMLRFLQHSFNGLTYCKEPYVSSDLVLKLKPKVVLHEVADRYFAYPQ